MNEFVMGMKIMKMMNINIVDKIREVLEMTNSESTAYYNRESDEIVWVFEYMDNDTKLLDEIEDNFDKIYRIADSV